MAVMPESGKKPQRYVWAEPVLILLGVLLLVLGTTTSLREWTFSSAAAICFWSAWLIHSQRGKDWW